MVSIAVTRSERRAFRSDMREFRKISAAHTSLLKVKEKYVKSQSEHQAALGQAKLQYELAADKFYLKYDESPVMKSVRKQDQKISKVAMLVFVASLALAVRLFLKGQPGPQEKDIMEFFQHNAALRVGSMLSAVVGFASLFLMIPLEERFSGRPSSTFDDISYKVEIKK